MGAFGNGASLADSLAWELTENFGGREVAAEWIDPTHPRAREFQISRTVGLLVAKGAIKRRFTGDVWSVATANGRLQKTREAVATHTECFCAPKYRAIVVTRPWGQYRAPIRRAILDAAQKYGLPIVDLNQRRVDTAIRRKK